MKVLLKRSIAVSLGLFVGAAFAHDIDEAGSPVCLEANYMMADAMNSPFGVPGPGRVIEMNIITGTPGITVPDPFTPAHVGTDICPSGIVCDNGIGGGGPWKPTGVLSGGENGHAFITSAAQQVLTEFHRDGTPIRSMSYKPFTGNPEGGAGFGTVPRPLGTQLMPNGNLIQAICDANFFNASNSDQAAEGGLEANQYFPPVNTTPDRSANSRLLVIDQETLEVIDEYSQPPAGAPGHELWGCVAGIMFSNNGMYVSTFHGAAVLEIDWKAGIDNEKSEGVGSNSAKGFKIGKRQNQAVVTNVIDFRLRDSYDDPSRRDSLRAVSFDESGNIYATDRARSEDCLRGEVGPGGCNPGVFRQRVHIASAGFDDENPGSGWNDPLARRTVALDPGVNVIAGIRTNRMSAPACEYVQANRMMFSSNAGDNPNYGYAPYEDLCDVETVLVAASAMNPGEIRDGCAGGHPTNACFKPGGGVAEYLTHPNWTDGGDGWGGGCNGDPTDPAGNLGCAQPVATFDYTLPGSDATVNVDPRMLMVIHEAFGQ
jgi:hypothetical protein